MKNKTWRKPRHRIITRIVRFFLLIHLKIKYRFKHDKSVKFKEGAIILSNHVTTMDPFMVGALIKGPMYFMTTMDLFQNKRLGKLIRWLVNPIPKQKSKPSDLAAIKASIKVAKENGSIVIFPEGNRTLSGKLGYIEPSIVKLVKMLKKPLVLVNIEGGYGCDPRFSQKVRKGQVKASFKAIYQYDEIKDMDNDELFKIIVDGLTVNDLDPTKKFKSERSAEYLERVFYKCPICNEYHQIYSEGNNVYCKKCGLKVEYLENLRFKANYEKFKFETVYDWYTWQINEAMVIEYTDDKLIYSDSVKLFEPRFNQKKLFLGEGKMELYNDHFKFVLSKEELIIKFEEIEGITLVGKKKMNIYANDKTFQVLYDDKINFLKYMHTYYIIKNKKVGNENGFIGI